jgi:hypothetical protein
MTVVRLARPDASCTFCSRYFRSAVADVESIDSVIRRVFGLCVNNMGGHISCTPRYSAQASPQAICLVIDAQLQPD